jgi:hypothetical protein
MDHLSPLKRRTGKVQCDLPAIQSANSNFPVNRWIVHIAVGAFSMAFARAKIIE